MATNSDVSDAFMKYPGLARWIQEVASMDAPSSASLEGSAETFYIPQLKKVVSLSNTTSTAMHLVRAVAKAPEPEALLQLIGALYSAWKVVPTLGDSDIAVVDAVWRLTGRSAGPARVLTLNAGHSTERDVMHALQSLIPGEEVTSSVANLIQKGILRLSEGHLEITF